MRIGLVIIFLLTYGILGAVNLEGSASANALSGLTAISQSVGDYSLSPVIGLTGACSTWQKPFSQAETSIYGFHTAFRTGSFIVATGLNYLNHPDYRWQNEYLALGIYHAGFALGVSQHLEYEKIAQESWYDWKNDFALKYNGSEYGSEIRYQACGSSDAAWTLSATHRLSKAAEVCSAYTWHKQQPDSYSVASSVRIATPLLLQTSWQSEPARFGAGLKFSISKVELMYAVRTHAELSLTHCLDLGILW